MAEAKRQHDWHIASSVMALTAEINRDRKRRRKPFKPDDFNPYTVTRSVPVKATVEQVAHLLNARFQPRENDSPCPKSAPDPPTSNC
ncbi:hypothetical protein Poly21_20230 [Allorhodopirellula heiligendammensis]|uniref:Uncharacterized protein n=1 Tax=Allorhodopirellula heiligendammensis TaxID=2714739 RepID=A0A5C6C6V2_9BACT|nr:hypothetical protein Poly21_20230 [Allorhodopirellula heiligendammensis]